MSLYVLTSSVCCVPFPPPVAPGGVDSPSPALFQAVRDRGKVLVLGHAQTESADGGGTAGGGGETTGGGGGAADDGGGGGALPGYTGT